MGSFARYLPFAVVLSILLLPYASAETVQDSVDIDIDSYEIVKIVFDDGESLELEANITADPDPITIFLIKGDMDYLRWKETEDIDINAILAGEKVTSGNSSFKVIQSFSMTNTTSFEASISIGEKDTYYLVMIIHREIDMSKDDILSRASRVDFVVKYEEKKKDVPFYLIPIAIIVFLVGTALIVFYFRSARTEEEPVPEEQPSGRRRSPPLR